MNANETNSAVNSGATSTNVAAKPESTTNAAVKKPALTEAQFLAKQADAAKAAIENTWTDLKHSLTNNVDVRQWAKQYPWITTAAAVAAGVAAGYALTPRTKNEAMEMWEHLKERFAPADEESTTENAKHSPTGTPQPSVLGSILREAIKVATPILASLASGAFTTSDAPSGNGHEGTPSGDAKPPVGRTV